MKKPELFISLLFSILLFPVSLSGQEPPKPDAPTEVSPPERGKVVEKRQIISNWRYAHYESDKLIWDARGNSAEIVGEGNVTVAGLELVYYLSSANKNPASEVPPDAAKTTDKIVITSNEGYIRNQENRVLLKGNVAAQWERMNKMDQMEANDKLTTTELWVDFATKSISSSDVVSITHLLEPPRDDAGADKKAAQIFIKGKGFQAEPNLSSFTFSQDAQVTMQGVGFTPLLFNLPSAGGASEEKKTAGHDTMTIVSEQGMSAIPATYPRAGQSYDTPAVGLTTRQADDSKQITFTGKVVLTQGGVRLYTEHLEVMMVRSQNQMTRLNEYLISYTRAYGGVRINEWSEPISPADTSFRWSSESDTFIRDDNVGTVLLTATNSSLVTVKTARMTALARYISLKTDQNVIVLKGEKKVVMDMSSGDKDVMNQVCLTAEDDIYVDLSEGRGIFQRNVRVVQKPLSVTNTATAGTSGYLQADRLVLFFQPETHTFKKMRAEGNVAVTALDGSWASGERLEWFPDQLFIEITSNYKAKAWHKNTTLESTRIKIYTTPNAVNPMGQWERMESPGGNIKFSPK